MDTQRPRERVTVLMADEAPAVPGDATVRILLAEFMAAGCNRFELPCPWPVAPPCTDTAGAGPEAFGWPPRAEVEYTPRTGHWVATVPGMGEWFSHRDIAVVHEMITRAVTRDGAGG